MKNILNIRIDKILCEKKKQPFGPIQISSNNQIIDISKSKMMDDSDGIAVKFKYSTKYLSKEVEIGNIDLSGKVFYNGPDHENIFDSWENEKKIDPKVAANIINIILSEASIMAVIISNQIKLPPPIPLPRTKAEMTKTKEVDTSYID